MDLIDRRALLDALYDNEYSTLCPLDEVSGVVDSAPTVEAVPAKRSYWEECETSSFWGYDKNDEAKWVTRKFYRCERCRKGTAVRSNFCPNCGAKMDGGAEDG